jgi:hypothetical protein
MAAGSPLRPVPVAGAADPDGTALATALAAGDDPVLDVALAAVLLDEQPASTTAIATMPTAAGRTPVRRLMGTPKIKVILTQLTASAVPSSPPR